MRVLCRISSLIVFSGALASVCRANSQNNGDFHSTQPSSSFENSPFARGGATRSPRSSKEKRDNEFSFPEDTRQPNFPIVPPFIRKSFTSQRQRNLNYKDILECTSPQVRWPDENMSEDGQKFDFEETQYDLFEADETNDFKKVDLKGKLEGNLKLSHSPVVYQFYGRSRARGNGSDSIHFVLLGPNVDHWKVVGQLLASRGFNAMACERIVGNEKDRDSDRSKDAPNLVLEILDVLKWNKAVLVGCDRESILAMETALMLAPDRVAGLVLCGELSEADRLVQESGVKGLDDFLRRILHCPFVIVGAGDSPTVIPGSSAHLAVETDSSSNDKCLILGGGSAPHRTKPEQFAWVLTRFVEERLMIHNKEDVVTARPTASREKIPKLFRNLNLPFGMQSLMTPEGRLLLGRATAAALFYITTMRVMFVQYGIMRATLLGIKSRYNSVAAFRRNVVQAITAFVLNYGYIPRLFSVKNINEDEKEELSSEEDNRKDIYPTIEEDNIEQGEKGNEKEEEVVGGEDIEEQPRSMPTPFFFLDQIVT